MPHDAWKTLERRPLLQSGRFLKVEGHRVQLPDGKIIDDWTWVITPDYVNILACTHAGRFLCFRQVKYAVPGPCLAPPGGYVEPGEAPLAAARRELQEETGYVSDDWHALGSYVVDSNRGVGNAHLFLALKAREAGGKIHDDLEEQHLVQLTRGELEQALDHGQIPVLGFGALLGLGLRRLDHLATGTPTA